MSARPRTGAPSRAHARVAPTPSANFAQALLNTAAASGARPALVESAATTSYDELVERSLDIATYLRERRLEPGDRVAMLLRRGADAAAAFFGVLSAGGIAVIANETLRPRQIEHILNHSGATVLLTSSAITDRLPRRIETSAHVVEAATVPSAGGAALAPRIAGDVAQIVYTSGSTGAPKGVTLSHGNLWAGMQAVVDYLGITEDDRLASFLPFSFDYGLNQLLCCVGTGATLVVDSSPVPGRLVKTVRSEEITVLAAVPPLWLQLLEVESFRAEPFPSLRVMTNTGGRVPREAVRQLRTCHPETDLVLMYGLTEAFRSTYLAPGKVDAKPESIGSAIPGAEVLVLADDLRPCAPGETGELVHRGPTVALGYWDDETTTAAVFRSNPARPPGTPDVERVVFSGDLVQRDGDGDIFFVGRRDAMIKTLGYRVSPDEVADVLYASGEVVEVVVSAEPDDARGDGIVAYVVLAQHGELTRLEDFATQELPRYMQPSRIEIRESLSRTSSGKFDANATARAHDPD